MPFGIPDPNDPAVGVNELARIQEELADARNRLKQYQAWVDSQGALQRLRRSNPAHPILLVRNSVIILSFFSLFGLVFSVVVRMVDGSYSRQLEALDSATGMSLTGAFLLIGILTLLIWIMLGLAATGFSQDIPLSPGEAAGLERIRRQIKDLETKESALASDGTQANSQYTDKRKLDMSLGRPPPSKVDRINQDIARLAENQAKKNDFDQNWDPEPTSPNLGYSKGESDSGQFGGASPPRNLLKALKSVPPTQDDENVEDDPTAPQLRTPSLDKKKHVPLVKDVEEFVTEEDLSVEVTDNPSGAWDPSLPTTTGTAGVYKYTEVLEDLSDDYDLEPDPATEELEDLWGHIKEDWLRNAMAQAERLADRLPDEAHIEISSVEHTPFTLVIEAATPGITVRTMMHFVEFLAAIPTPPMATIELIRVAHLNRDFHRNVQAALKPNFSNNVTVTRVSNRIDIRFNQPYSGWRNYPYLPVDE